MSLQLSTAQQAFATEFARDTGLDAKVVAAWLRNEEPAEPSNSPAYGRYNFLNIGNTDSGPIPQNATDPAWLNPVSAAKASAAWLKGSGTAVQGYQAPPASIQAIATPGLTPSEQIADIQGSGWASGGETALPSLYQQAGGGVVTANPNGLPSFAPSFSTGAGVPVLGPLSSGVTGTIGAATSIPEAIAAVVKWIPKAFVFMALLAVAGALFVSAFKRSSAAARSAP